MNARPAPDDDAPLDPAAMLALIQTQQSEMERRMAAATPWIVAAWGIAWVVGFGALFLIDGARPGFAIPLPVAVGTFIALMIAAVIASAVLGARMGRGVKQTKEANFNGAVFGVTGSASFFAMYVFAVGLTRNGMDPDLLNIFFPTSSALIVGIFYALAGGFWRIVPMIWMGAWIALVGLVAPFFGYPHHYLFFALAGGGGFLVGGIVAAALLRSGRWVV
ncbi:hypothetical protein CLV46_2404 [Diaminobutyricimonas aerilata]|uniref:Uncharacterized protein n=1 Tax=Diaminobutyricimonas aerilata TaxID=1162967 RepID=A0A2M9CLQ0_9MICO|nr:hypothetical protein [Diaminobutyricimonas aerilata]PJJ72827.1 hypothetical protein CLV46_2404 [Diaminobutyricimonas aerilata]